MKRAFSLVELSIVLVILGLLVGAVMTGQSLLRASQLRAIITESAQYRAAAIAFQTQYRALPGDFRYATRSWGRLNSNTDCVTTTGTAVGTPGVCDGNGDGNIAAGGAASQSGEMFQFWQHLAQASLIDGNYTGLAGSAGGSDTIPSTNSPASRLKLAGWGVGYYYNTSGTTNLYAGYFGNYLAVGGVSSGNLPYTPLLLAEEAWNIDKKEDDGKPGAGTIRARDGSGFGGTGCTTSTSATDVSGNYNTASNTTTKSCSLLFVDVF